MAPILRDPASLPILNNNQSTITTTTESVDSSPPPPSAAAPSRQTSSVLTSEATASPSIRRAADLSQVGLNEPEISDVVKCECEKHEGREMLNEVFKLSVNYLWECIFGHTESCRKYWDSRKFSNLKVGPWKLVNNFPMRQLEFNVDLGPVGKPKNVEDQVK